MGSWDSCYRQWSGLDAGGSGNRACETRRTGPERRHLQEAILLARLFTPVPASCYDKR